uniref:Glycosyltransferase family 2 protein n=1 Tax=Roseihalotalea indica TaxID=2867963 RepID=A0AA49GQ00_9BACT|nr:glycosyltransferase family 2 protein [Tunicatimonas sp. TK19036]
MSTISVIIPFLDAEKTLTRSISSITEQTFQRWELILVDNNSSDGSTIIAQSYAQSDERIRIFHESTVGVAHAFNTGLTHATGSYIARMDADDFAHPTRLEKQLNFLQHYPGISLVSGQVRYQSSVSQPGMQHYVHWVNGIVLPEQIMLNRFVELPLINPTIMFRRECLEQYGSYRDGDFPEDYELILRWLAQGAKMAKIDDVVLDWHDSANRLTRTHPRYSTEAFYRIKTHFLALWLKQKNPFYPKVVVWGAGRKSRQRARLLGNEGVQIVAYIDVVRNKTQERPCIFYEDIASPGEYFVLSYVANRGQREKIRDFLVAKGYREGIDFLLAA